MTVKRGMDAKLYYKAGGLGAPGSWSELTNVRDNTLNLEKGEADVTTRGNNGWRATIGTLKDGSVEFEMVWDPEDDGFDAIQDAYFNDSLIALAIMDGDIDTGSGLQADFSITNFTRNEPLEEAMTVNVTAKPTYSANAPQWIENGATPTASA